jgi:hypothetical protein
VKKATSNDNKKELPSLLLLLQKNGLEYEQVLCRLSK